MLKPEKNKSMKLIPKYVGGVELYFHIGEKTIRVKQGDFLPELPVEQAKQRGDFVIIKKRSE